MNTLELFETFKSEFSLRVPPPTKRPLEKPSMQFWFSVVWSMSAVIAIGLGTYSEFLEASKLGGLNLIVSYARGVSFMIAVDLGLVITATLKNVFSKKYHVDSSSLSISAAIAIVISMVAGTNAIVGAIPGVPEIVVFWMRVAMVLLMGVGGTLLVKYSGEVVGSYLARYMNAEEIADREYQDSYQEWLSKVDASWTASDYYKVSKADIRVLAAQEGARVKAAQEVGVRVPFKNYGSSEQKDRIIAYVDQIWNSENRIPGPTEIHNVVGVAKSYAKTVLDSWNANDVVE